MKKWLALVGRPSLAASGWRARRPALPGYFHIKKAIKRFFCHSEPPQAAKNLVFAANQETLRLRLRVTK